MYIVNVHLVCYDGWAETFEERLKEHASNSLTQDGCEQFSVSRDHDNPNSFRIWEVYRDEAAFQEHVGAEFMAEWRAASKDLIESRSLVHGTSIA